MQGLQFLEIAEEVEKVEGWFSREQMEVIYPFAKLAKNVVEIGTYAGRSTLFWALCNPEATIITIDRCIGAPGFPMRFISEETVKRGKILAIHGDSYNVSKRFNLPIDFLFIDGGHHYLDCSQDIVNWLPKLDGVIAVHDYPSWPGVKEAVETHLKEEVILINDNHDMFVGRTKYGNF